MRCPKDNSSKLQLSLDGIQESKSSSISTDVFCISFQDCKQVYPLRLIRPCNKYKYDEQEEIRKVIDDINTNNCELTDCVLDKPKRSDVKCTLNHNATYPCEYCEAGAVLIEDCESSNEIHKKYELRRRNINNTIEFLTESPGTSESKKRDEVKIEELKLILIELENEEKSEIKAKTKRKQLTWPSSTMNARLRTQDLIKYIATKIKNGSVLDKHEKKGLKGESHLLYQRNFHFIDNISAEYMHSSCLGVVKRLVELTFQAGEQRIKVSKRKLSDTTTFNEAMKTIQMVREFSRRCRNLDLGIIKAQEYRNLIFFFFTIVTDDCIEDNYPQEKMIWLYLAYVIRACVLPNTEFDNIDTSAIKSSCNRFYHLYEKNFGPRNCTYSIHVVISHALRIRGKSPLTARSAFKYENFYSEMKQLFQPGTSSPLKQILGNTLIKRSLEKHYCQKEIKYDVKKIPNKGLENNSLIYVYNNEKKQHFFYNIIEKNEDKSFQCYEQGKFPFTSDLTPELNWANVGVYRVGPSNSNYTKIYENEIDGKVLKVGKHFITCPLNVLREQ